MRYTRKPKTRVVLRNRDEVAPEIPEDHLICNAARPLYGYKEWDGDFITGRFYAAIDPASEDAPFYLHRNAELDARLLEFATEQRCIDRALAHYLVQYPDVYSEINVDDPSTRAHLIDRGIDLLNDDQEKE